MMIAIAVVKTIHSLVFFGLVASLAVVAWAALTGRPTRLTWNALAIVMFEVGAVGLCRGTCPLTTLAERMGAESGSVTDLFLPKWLADQVFVLGGGALVVSLFVLSLRLARRQRST